MRLPSVSFHLLTKRMAFGSVAAASCKAANFFCFSGGMTAAGISPMSRLRSLSQ